MVFLPIFSCRICWLLCSLEFSNRVRLSLLTPDMPVSMQIAQVNYASSVGWMFMFLRLLHTFDSSDYTSFHVGDLAYSSLPSPSSCQFVRHSCNYGCRCHCMGCRRRLAGCRLIAVCSNLCTAVFDMTFVVATALQRATAASDYDLHHCCLPPHLFFMSSASARSSPAAGHRLRRYL